MEVQILRFIDGSRLAKGATIIIDVFRAFSLECYLYGWGASRIYPVGDIDEALILRDKIKKCEPSSKVITIGERHGVKLPGFDFGNSPSQIEPHRDLIKDAIVIHTTSAGTQGIVNSVNSDFVVTGSLVNARAVASYIKSVNPSEVSIVAMGNNGTRTALEDDLCAEYLKALIEGDMASIEAFENIDLPRRIEALKDEGGRHFFNPDNQEVFPSEDFFMCTKTNRFDFVIRNEKDDKYGMSCNYMVK